ncbi:protein sarah [Trichonephila clavipes]|nr:protein sarah [Trichonephila clavipes]
MKIVYYKGIAGKSEAITRVSTAGLRIWFCKRNIVGRENMLENIEDDVDISEELADTSDLPTSLIITNLESNMFSEDSQKNQLEEIFRQFDAEATFQYFKSFRRVRVNFTNPTAAANARIQCHQTKIGDSIVNCYFAQPVTSTGNKDGETSDSYLQPPSPVRQFLISPPASPPVGWEPVDEAQPCINYDLLAALAKLTPDQSQYQKNHLEQDKQENAAKNHSRLFIVLSSSSPEPSSETDAAAFSGGRITIALAFMLSSVSNKTLRGKLMLRYPSGYGHELVMSFFRIAGLSPGPPDLLCRGADCYKSDQHELLSLFSIKSSKFARELADPNFGVPGKIDLLIGAEAFFDIIKEGIIRTSDNRLAFRKSVFRYIATGTTHSYKQNQYCGFISEMQNIDDNLQKFWEIETINEGQKPLSEEEEYSTVPLIRTGLIRTSG